MKELSIEEKAKAYDEALEKAKNYHSPETACNVKVAMENLFPQLKESKDERIRKRIIHALHGDVLEMSEIKEAVDWLEAQGEKDEEILILKDKIESLHAAIKALKEVHKIELEKQGKQKLADKVEPKFNVGDWVVSEITGSIYQIKNCIENLSNHKYGYDLINGGYICSDEVNRYHLWTIQDAKDGDVLCTYECNKPKIVFILKGMPKKPYVLGYHCYYNIMYPHFEFDSEKGCLAPNEEDVKPATKEQRNLLFQKMKEAGYVWDADKLELKKIEQEPAEWSEENESYIRYLIECLEVCVKGTAIKMTPSTAQKYINWLKSLRPQNRWKPSEEQMKALEHAISCYSGISPTNGHEVFILEIMKEQLKKLREE